MVPRSRMHMQHTPCHKDGCRGCRRESTHDTGGKRARGRGAHLAPFSTSRRMSGSWPRFTASSSALCPTASCKPHARIGIFWHAALRPPRKQVTHSTPSPPRQAYACARPHARQTVVDAVMHDGVAAIGCRSPQRHITCGTICLRGFQQTPNLQTFSMQGLSPGRVHGQ